MPAGVFEMLLEARDRVAHDLFFREKQVVGVEPVGVDVALGLDPGLLQAADVLDRLPIEGLDIPDESVAGGQAAEVFPPRGTASPYLSSR